MTALEREEGGTPPVPVRDSVLRSALQVLVLILAVIGVLWVLYRLEGVLLLVILSVFFAYLIAPIVAFFRRSVSVGGRSRALPLPLAIGAVYLLLFGALAIAVWLLLPVVAAQFSALGRELPGYLARAQARLHAWQTYERGHFPRGARDAINGAVEQAYTSAAAEFKSGIFPWLARMLGYLPWLVLVPIFALFLLKDAETFRQSALRLFPRGRLRWRGREFFEDVNGALASYVRAQLIACVIVGAACTIGFAIIGIPYAVVLGIAAGLLEFIPLAGPLTVGILAVVFAFFHSPAQALAVFLFLAILRLLEDYVVYPRIIGRGIHLHPLAVILAILCGAELGGLTGIFLSIPVVAILSVAFRHWREHQAEDAAIARSAGGSG
ncbi:MAG: AI-2E family transporter [Acidobacteriota bacterium]